MQYFFIQRDAQNFQLMKKIILILLVALGYQPVFAQKDVKKYRENTPLSIEQLAPLQLTPEAEKAFEKQQPTVEPLFKAKQTIKSIPSVAIPPKGMPTGFKIITQERGLPTMISGSLLTPRSGKNAPLVARCGDYLEQVKSVMRIQNPNDEFVVKSERTDDLGQRHVRMAQRFKNIPVWGSEIILHEKNGTLDLLNGGYFPTPSVKSVVPTLAATQAEVAVREDLGKKMTLKTLSQEQKKYIGGEQFRSELVIFHVEDRLESERLAWHVVAYPNMMHRWEYFVDAESGVVLDSYRASCDFLGHIHDQLCTSHDHAQTADLKKNEEKITSNSASLNSPTPSMDGKTVANNLDLVDSTRRINTYQIGQNYLLIDASRSMFSATQSRLPQEPVGAIVTLDNRNADGGAEAYFITTTTNNWADKKAVSAHYNAGRAYEYFNSVFKRNSIDGNGGNVLSFINVTDEGVQMDNAFWNGEAMFYGNGDRVFKPLAGALDVAGHEIGHGVIQNTANLRYQGESGALNESFADIFGAMIDRADWKMGEDIIKDTRTFPSGALRDLQNPNNGVAKGQPAWQPAKYSERFTGTGDNGGVHINSGIPNRAYYLFATNTAVGKDRAEQIFYRALDVYLTATSKFIDLRASVEKSCADLFPNNAAILSAAQTAFTTVEIGSGGNTGGTTQPTLPTNTGKDWLLHVSDDQTELLLTDYASTLTTQLRQFTFFDKGVLSRPSITDDGTKAVFVGTDKFVYFVDINWTTNQFTQAQKLLTTGNWKNAAISKDGTRVVLNRSTQDSTARQLVVYNIAAKTQKVFTLFNPTTSDKQTRTNEVQFSDAIEWDYSGEFVMYDAFNEIPIAGTSKTINYWDIGFISVWDNAAKTFGQGEIFKMFSGLPENTSVGNATFAKKSPNIIAFDYIEEDADDNFIGFLLYGANIETGDLSTSDDGIFRNDALGVPSFSNLDDKLLFTTKGIADTNILALATIDLAADKINPKSGSRIPVLLEDAQKGSWFNNAKRVISSATELTPIAFQLAPNPFGDNIALTFESEKNAQGAVEITDLLGKLVARHPLSILSGKNNFSLKTETLARGTYLLRLTFDQKMSIQKIVKM